MPASHGMPLFFKSLIILCRPLCERMRLGSNMVAKLIGATKLFLAFTIAWHTVSFFTCPSPALFGNRKLFPFGHRHTSVKTTRPRLPNFLERLRDFPLVRRLRRAGSVALRSIFLTCPRPIDVNLHPEIDFCKVKYFFHLMDLGFGCYKLNITSKSEVVWWPCLWLTLERTNGYTLPSPVEVTGLQG